MNNPSTTNLTLLTLVSRHPDLIGTDMDGDLVMMSIEKGTYYGLSGVGPTIWALLVTPTTGQAISAALCEEYAVTPAQCEADVLTFLQTMEKNNLLVIG